MNGDATEAGKVFQPTARDLKRFGNAVTDIGIGLMMVAISIAIYLTVRVDPGLGAVTVTSAVGAVVGFGLSAVAIRRTNQIRREILRESDRE